MDEVVRGIGTPILGLALFALWGLWSLIRRSFKCATCAEWTRHSRRVRGDYGKVHHVCPDCWDDIRDFERPGMAGAL